jgi:phosphatidate cytidylyltransferase
MSAVQKYLDVFLKPTPAVLTAEVALGLIALGTIALGVIGAVRPRRDLSFYRRRFASWWVMGIVFLVAVAVGPGITLVFIAAISFLAIREYFTVVNTRPEDRRALLWVYLSIPAQYALITLESYGLFVIFIPVCMLLSIPLRIALHGRPEGFVGSFGRIHWGMMLFIFGISHLAYVNYLEPPKAPAAKGSLLLFVVILTEAADAVQFLLARLSKRWPVAPELGTRKTWPGYFGSVAAGAALGVSLQFLTRFNRLDAGLIGAGIAVCAFAGSLVITALRRDVEAAARDTRVLDHIDSHCYTAPLFFHLVYLLPE